MVENVEFITTKMKVILTYIMHRSGMCVEVLRKNMNHPDRLLGLTHEI